MFETIANSVLLILGLVVVVIWIVSLAKWDGKGCKPNKDDCDHCPFPCDKYKNDI